MATSGSTARPGAGAAPAGMTGGEAAVRSDRRMATVLFADIVGSTRMVAAADPEDAQDRLDRVLRTLSAHVERYGGTVCQTLGDGILAVFGAPNSLEDHAVRACFAADAIVREARSGMRDADPVAVRVGLSSGEILWDSGALNRQDRAPAVGRTVHLAAKLQQMAPENGVRLSEPTAVAAQDWAELALVGRFAVLPQDEVGVFTLLAMRRRRRRADDDPPLFGRDDVLGELQAAVTRALDRQGGACLLAAPAGLGKSRLAEAVSAFAWRVGARVLDWRMHAMQPVGVADPLHGLVTALLDGDLPETRAPLLRLIEGHGARKVAAEVLADLLLPAEERSGAAQGEDLLVLAAEAVGDLVRAAARRTPLLLLAEDLHWAGSSAAAVLDRLVPLVGALPLFLLGTAREVPSWLPDGVRIVELAPLPDDAAAELTAALVGSHPALDELRASLVRRTQGNPFFLQECVRGMVAGGRLTGIPGDYRPGGLGDDRLPETVQALLAARIDTLPERHRTTLLAASVAGATFDAALLAALVGCDRATLAEILTALADADFLDNTRLLPRLEYSFRHALLHEAAYATLTRRDRRAIHGRLVTLLESPDFADLAGRKAAIARHAYRSEAWAKAAEAGGEAGREAFQLSLTSEAVDLLGKAVDAHDRLGGEGGDPVRAVDLRLMLARATMPLGVEGHGPDVLDRAIGIARTLGDPDRECAAWLLRSAFDWAYGSLRDAVTSAEHAVEASRAAQGGREPHFEVELHHGNILLETGNVRAALPILRHAAAVAAQTGQRQGRYWALDSHMMLDLRLARGLIEIGEIDAARRHLAAAEEHAAESPFPFSRIFCWTFIAEDHLLTGGWKLAASYAGRALQLMEQTGSRIHYGLATALAGLVTVTLDGSEEGVRQIDKGLAQVRQRRTAAHEAHILLLRAQAMGRLGNHFEALRDADAALALAERRHQGLVAVRAGLESARHAGQMGDARRSQEMLAQARTWASALGLSTLLGQCDGLHARIGSGFATLPAATGR